MRLKRELLPERIRETIVSREPDLQRVRRAVGQVLLCPDLARLDRRFMDDHRVHRSVEVIEEDFPIGEEKYAKTDADNIELNSKLNTT
jgi:hypothetical protein